MKLLYLTTSLLVIFSLTHAQQWEWAIQENVRKFAVDPAGNVFTHNDSTIKRFDSNGIFEWQIKYSGNLFIADMVADNSGNLYMTGGFTDFSIGSSSYNSTGNWDIFFCKIDIYGTIIWSRVFAGANDNNVTDLSLTKTQKLLICGLAGAGTTIGSTYFAETQLYAGKYDLNGNQELLIKHSGGTAWEISADSSANIYLLGGININDTLNLGNGTKLYGAIGTQHGSHFISKFDVVGNIIWAKDLGTNYYQPFKHLGIDNKGDFYLTKWKRYEGFELHKFSKNGNFIWSHALYGIYGDCSSLSIDSNDSIWLAGFIWNNPFNGNPFMWQFDISNNLTETTNSTISANGNNIANDQYNNVYVSGSFNDSAVFGTTTLLASAGNYFLAKMGRGSIANSTPDISENQETVTVFPNPTTGQFHITMGTNDGPIEISIYDPLGKSIYHDRSSYPGGHPIDLSKQHKGIYFIEIIKSGEKSSRKIVLQ